MANTESTPSKVMQPSDKVAARMKKLEKDVKWLIDELEKVRAELREHENDMTHVHKIGGSQLM